MLHLLKGIGNNAPDDLPKAQTCIPDAEPRCCFGFGVPLTAEKHQAWRNCCFKDSKENPSSQKSGIIMSSCGASSCDPP